MPATEQTWRDQKLMHKIFAFSGVVMSVATVWMFAADHSREWKQYQRKFRNIEVSVTQWQEAQEQTAAKEAEHERLEGLLNSAKAKVTDAALIAEFNKDVEDEDAAAKIESLYSELTKAEGEEAAVQAKDRLLTAMRSVIVGAKFLEDNLLNERKFKAADHGVGKSAWDIAIRDDATEEQRQAARKKADAIKAELDEINARYEQASSRRLSLQKTLDQITAEEDAARKNMEENRKALVQLQTALSDRRATWFTSAPPFLGQKFLEQPIIDAFGSPLGIENLWTENLTIKYGNFKSVVRYDRCTTCHQALEKTVSGSAVEPLFKSEQHLTVQLATPAEKPQAESSDEDKVTTEPSLENVYGISLAPQGALNRDDVTVSSVTMSSLGSTAKVYTGDDSIQTTVAQLRENQKLADPAPASNAVGGLQVGDVILEINGNKVFSSEKVERILLETADWGKPLTLTVRRGYPSPYTTHPRLDLYVGSMSPHKLQIVGCTICHEGQGSATEFKWAAHTPSDLKTRRRWSAEYGWFNNHHWPYPMASKRFMESTCLKCHHDVDELQPSEKYPDPPAPKLLAGRELIRRMGCYGCHEINGFDGPNKRIGPDMRLEPNYYAAALQLAHISKDRFSELTRQRALYDETLKSLSDSEDDAPEKEKITKQIALLDSHLANLQEVRELSQTLSTDNEAASERRRLLSMLQSDETREVSSDAAGDESLNHAHSSDAHKLALVLKDSETPGKLSKVGPSLRYVADKLDKEFLYDWIRQPSHFRPATRMPQFFGHTKHLNEAGKHLAEEMEPIEILSIATYLQNYSQDFQYDAPDEGSLSDEEIQARAERGKALFEVKECLACHKHQAFPSATSTQGPDLSAIGDKLSGEKGRRWLYSWIKQPNRYHVRTLMPKVFLEPLEGNEGTDPIADVVEFLLVSKTGWKADNPQLTPDPEALDHLALEHLSQAFFRADAEIYLKSGIPESMRSELKGAEVELVVPETNSTDISTEQKLLYIGRKSLAKYGCYACHDIPGFEDAKPIGTTLAEWGRKDSSKLAFEHITHYLQGHGHGHSGEDSSAEEHHETTTNEKTDPFYLREIQEHNRTGFIYQKLREPRSYDFEKTDDKGFNEWLRMPQFPLNAEEREAIITFVLGLVAEPPADEFIYHPTPRRKAIIEGRQVLEKFNCGGCHILELEKWDIAYSPETFEALPESPTYPYLKNHFTPEQIAESLKTDNSGLMHATLEGMIRVNEQGLQDTYVYDQEGEEYVNLNDYEPEDKVDTDALAYGFSLWKPTLLAGKEFSVKAPLPEIPRSMIKKRYPSRGGDLAKRLLARVVEIDKGNKGAEGWGWLPPPLVGEGAKVQPDWLYEFMLDPHPIRPAVFLRMPKFNLTASEATKLVEFFAAMDDVDYPHDFKPNTRSEHLELADQEYQQAVGEQAQRDRFDDAMKIVTDQNYCIKCHSIADFDPKANRRAMAPNLALVYERLRPEFVRDWIAKPSWILPYTGMPENIIYDEQAPDLGTKIPMDLYHGNSIEQVDALVDLLMNFDEYSKRRTLIAPLVKPLPATPTDAAPTVGGE